MGKAGGGIGDHVLIEEDGTRNMAGGIFDGAVAPLCGQIPGGIDELESGGSEVFFDPIRRNDETASFTGHALLP